MSTSPAEPTPTTEPPAAAPTPTPDPAPTTDPKPAEPSASSPWDDPTAAKAEIEKLRKENGAARTNAKAQAAEEARTELLATLNKALGKAEPETDPAKFAENLAAAQAETKQARVELAVFRAASAAGGDPAALLDSSSFLKSLDAVDPSDTAAITAAIQSAVAANPRLGAAPAGPTPPAPNPAQGAGANGAPGLEAQIAEATKAGNHRLAIALKRQLAASKATT